MKTIRQKKSIFTLVILCGVFFLLFFITVSNRFFNVQAQEMQAIHTFSDENNMSTREFIISIDKELKKRDTCVVKELQSSRDDFISLTDKASATEKSIIMSKIEFLTQSLNLIEEENYFQEEESDEDAEIKVNSETGISFEYMEKMIAVSSIYAGFSVRGWKLAADLLLFNIINKTEDIEYWSKYGNEIATASQIANDLAYGIKISSGFEQHSPGSLNGLFDDTVEGEAYNSLGSHFYFIKTDAGNGNVNISIIDRYDWKELKDGGSAGKLNNIMYRAQELGILTPFYTRINLIIPGSVPFKWRFIDSGIEITGLVSGDTVIADYEEKIYDLTSLPQAEVEPPVLYINSVGDGAFENCTSLIRFDLFSKIKTIGARAFKGCKKLPSTIDLNAVEVIGEEAFSGCSNLRVLNYTSKLKVIGKRAFYNCSDFNTLYSFENVESIGDEAFYNCDLYSLNSGSKIKTIGAKAFYHNRGLFVNAHLSSLESIGEEAFLYCAILQEIKSVGKLKTIGDAAFYGCGQLKKVYGLKVIESIGERAFSGCAELTEISDLGTLKTVGKEAFKGLEKLKITTPLTNLETVGDDAFSGCLDLSGVNVSGKLKTIGAHAFKNAKNINISVPLPDIEVIGAEAFYGNLTLRKIDSANKLREIGDGAFYGCKSLNSVTGDYNINRIGEKAFYDCSNLTVFDNLEKVTSIGARAFMNCTSITALAFPDAVSIGQEAFKGCTGLTSLCFARGNTPVSASIGARAFENCTNINEVVCDSFNVPTLGENCFPNNCGFTLLVPYNKSGEYTNIFAAYTSSVGYTTVRITLVCGGTESTKDVYYGQALGLSSFRKDGYLFRGWFGTADYKGQKRSLNEICTTKENFTLYGRLVSRSDIENYIAKLGTLADYYVQNGYESINSNTFSISDIAEYYRQRGSIYAGGELYKNIEVQEILTNVSHPYNIVVGNVGTSVREELEFIREHLGVCENIYVTGLSLGTFLNSLGYELNNYADDALLDMAREICNMAEARGSHIIFPTMFYAVSADYRTTAGLKSLDDIGANEAALFGIFPEMSTTGTLAVYGYSGFFTVEEYSVMSDEVKAEYENAARAFVTEIENSKYNNVNKLFFGDTLRLCNENKYSFVSEKGRAPSLQNAIFQHLMVGGETINNITEIFRANPRAGERMLMRVECNIGYTDNRMDMDKFSKAISKCLPDIRWALESGCKVILMASNKVDKDDASDWQAKEFNNGRFLSEFSQTVGVEARFVSVDNIYDVLNNNCSVYWISNLYPYEKYYAFPSA